jgi:hypothetical protein
MVPEQFAGRKVLTEHEKDAPIASAMANRTKPNAVNKLSPQQRVRVEMVKRGLKTGALATAIGYKTDSLTNLLNGNMTSHAAQCRIEDYLGMPFWSTPDEFAARQCEGKIKGLLRELTTRWGGQAAAMDNLAREYQALTAKLGINMVVLVLDGAPDSPVWKSADNDEPFHVELAAARAGTFDSSRMFDGCYVCFYYASQSQFAPTLTVLKKGIETRGLLDHARLFYIESESGTWVQVWPATAERF